MAYDQSVRTLMNNAGYDNSKIGYDANSGYVTYGTQNFMKPQMNVNGTTYTDPSSFDQAHNQYQQQQKANDPYQSPIYHPVDDNVPYEQRLANYAANPQAGQTELQRAMQALNGYTANNDIPRIDSAQAHISRVQKALGNANQPPGYNDIITNVYQQLMHPQQYDVYSSPEYKAAQDAMAYQAQQATRSAQESLGEAGFGRSTNLMDRAQGIQNDANQRILTQVVPQLIQTHSAQDQQKLSNMVGLLSPLMQQRQQDEIEKQGRIKLANELTRDYGTNVNPTMDTQLTYDQVEGKTPLVGQDQQLQSNQIMGALTGYIPDGKGGMMRTTAEQTRQLGELWKVADATGTIPNELADMYGIPRGTETQSAKQFAMTNSRLTDQYQSGIDKDLFEFMGKQGTAQKGPKVSEISTNIGRALGLKGDNLDTSNPQTKAQIESMIVTQTQDPLVAVPLYNMYGITVPDQLKQEYVAALKKVNP